MTGKSCVSLTKFIVDEDLFNEDAVSVYNKWIIASGHNYDKTDAQWVLSHIKQIQKINKKFLKEAVAIDSTKMSVFS